MHDLRHSFASFLINGGRSLYEVQQLLGHINSSMTQRYAHLAHETLLDACNVAGGLIGRLNNNISINSNHKEQDGAPKRLARHI